MALSIKGRTDADLRNLLAMSSIEKRDFKDSQLKETLTEITEKETKSLKGRICFATLLYLGTLVAYAAIFLMKEKEASIRGLALLNPVFLLATDIVMASLSPPVTKIKQNSTSSRASFVYSTAFQAFVLLFARVALCFNEEYWLVNMAIVYLVVQLVCAYDAT